MQHGDPHTSKKATRVGFAVWAWIAACLVAVFLVWMLVLRP
ncbi:hypothetical protein [Pseudacidovorax intermedius]|nr:hypothetical protein [Pseudacidovorax intermedius]